MYCRTRDGYYVLSKSYKRAHLIMFSFVTVFHTLFAYNAGSDSSPEQNFLCISVYLTDAVLTILFTVHIKNAYNLLSNKLTVIEESVCIHNDIAAHNLCDGRRTLLPFELSQRENLCFYVIVIASRIFFNFVIS